MLWSCAGKAAQDRLRLCCAETHRSCILDHHVVVLCDDCPVDGASQHQLEMRVGIGFPGLRAIEFLPADILEPWHELETQHPRDTQRDSIKQAVKQKVAFGEEEAIVWHTERRLR